LVRWEGDSGPKSLWLEEKSRIELKLQEKGAEEIGSHDSVTVQNIAVNIDFHNVLNTLLLFT
jgi:hypothetical protein